MCCEHCVLVQHECHDCDRLGGCDAGAMQQGAQHLTVPRPLLCAIHRPAVSATGSWLLSTACCSCLPLAYHLLLLSPTCSLVYYLLLLSTTCCSCLLPAALVYHLLLLLTTCCSCYPLAALAHCLLHFKASRTILQHDHRSLPVAELSATVTSGFIKPAASRGGFGFWQPSTPSIEF